MNPTTRLSPQLSPFPQPFPTRTPLILSRYRKTAPITATADLPADLDKFHLLSSVSETFDFLEGGLPFSQPGLVSATVFNPSSTNFLRVRDLSFVITKLTLRGERFPKSGMTLSVVADWLQEDRKIGPGQSAAVPVELAISEGGSPGRQIRDKLGAKEQAGCVKMEVGVATRDTVARANADDEESLQLQSFGLQFDCRHRDQSFSFSFRDMDGSVGLAAAAAPLRATPASESPDTSARPPFNGDEDASCQLLKCPILVTLAGVGVKARAAVDSHKFVSTAVTTGESSRKKSGKPQIFHYRLPDAWILAPHRAGAHNWEGQGFLAALQAIEQLAEKSSQEAHNVTLNGSAVFCPADPNALLVAGHSRGAHGALMLATKIPDRVLKVFAANGWTNREYYGDANSIFEHDLDIPNMDPSLKAVLESTVWENDNLHAVDNVCGIPMLLRTATEDANVNPFFMRKVARTVGERCDPGDALKFAEFGGGKGHWWWDSVARTSLSIITPNDGGVMMDKEVRYHHSLIRSTNKFFPNDKS